MVGIMLAFQMGWCRVLLSKARYDPRANRLVIRSRKWRICHPGCGRGLLSSSCFATSVYSIMTTFRH